MRRTDEITQLLADVRQGDRDAVNRLFSAVYQDLRKVAHGQLFARGSNLTLNTTALVHESYLKLVDRSRLSPVDRHHFFATVARAMRQIIVDYARRSFAAKRGGKDRAVSIDDQTGVLDEASIRISELAGEILGVDRALEHLNALDERLVQVVELRFFAGFSIEEVAEQLSVSPRTVKRDWQTARAFLYRELKDESYNGE